MIRLFTVHGADKYHIHVSFVFSTSVAIIFGVGRTGLVSLVRMSIKPSVNFLRGPIIWICLQNKGPLMALARSQDAHLLHRVILGRL